MFSRKIQLAPIQGFPFVISMPQAVDCDPQAVAGVSQSSVVDSMREGSNEIAVVLIG